MTRFAVKREQVLPKILRILVGSSHLIKAFNGKLINDIQHRMFAKIYACFQKQLKTALEILIRSMEIKIGSIKA